MNDYQQKLNDLLLTTARQNASDLHIGVGRRPTLRIDGVLIPLQKELILTPEMSEGLILALLTEEQKKYFTRKDNLIYRIVLKIKPGFGLMFIFSGVLWPRLCD